MVSKEKWTEEYYGIVEHYFWEPQKLNRMVKGEGKLDFAAVVNGLRQHEVALNHILNIFFSLAPHGLSQRLFKTFIPEWKVEDLHSILRAKPTSFPDLEFCQPDFLFDGNESQIAVEIKVKAKLLITQVIRYSLFLMDQPPDKPRAGYLVVIGPESFDAVWEKGITFSNYKAKLRETNVPASARKYAKLIGRSEADIIEYATAFPITYIRYIDLAYFLKSEMRRIREIGVSESGETLEHLIAGVLHEIEARGLIKARAERFVGTGQEFERVIVE